MSVANIFSRFGLAAVTLLIFQRTALASFPDVPESHPNFDAIQYVQEQGIVSGYPDGTYHADQTINRAEFVKIMIGVYRSLGNGYNPDDAQWENGRCTVYLEPEGSYSLSDVAQSSWYGTYVCYAATIGFISGYPDGTFRASNTINFVEAAKIIAGGFGFSGDEDYPSNPWYERYVQSLVVRKAIPSSITHLDQRISRGEMAEMIYRLKTGITDKPSKTYEDFFGKTDTTSVKLFFFNQHDVETASYEASFPVTRIIPKTPAVADAALRALFAGPTSGEYAWGARSDNLINLAKDYIGVTIHATYTNPYWEAEGETYEEKTLKNVALVNFRGGAFEYLNGAAGIQFMVKAAIEATLLNFPTVDHVFYQLDGTLFTEWDA